MRRRFSIVVGITGTLPAAGRAAGLSADHAPTPDEIRKGLFGARVELQEKDPTIARRMTRWDKGMAQGFAFAEDSEYDGIRALAEETFGRGALALPQARLRCSRPDR